MFRITNSHGNDNRGVRKFCRENGIPPTVANVERISREVRRSESENRAVERRHKELEATTGRPATYDQKGDVKARVVNAVQREIKNRPPR